VGYHLRVQVYTSTIIRYPQNKACKSIRKAEISKLIKHIHPKAASGKKSRCTLPPSTKSTCVYLRNMHSKKAYDGKVQVAQHKHSPPSGARGLSGARGSQMVCNKKSPA